MSKVFHTYGPTGLKFLIWLLPVMVNFQAQSLVYAQSGNDVVAVVNGRNITQRELDQSIIARLGPLQQQIYDLRKVALENLIVRMVLEGEAKRRGISLDELKRELTAASVAVPQSEVERSYAENFSAFGNMSPDEIKERLRLDLESKARMRNYREALSKLREGALVTSTLAEPTLPIGDSFADGPSRGAPAAAVTIIEFSDFQCPYCRETQPTLLKLLRTYGDRVKIAFKHLPLEMHEDAFSASRAAFCAREQDKFWEYHDALFASESLAREALTRIASNLRLDTEKFSKCLESAASSNAVQKDVQDARQLGINSTPSFIVNGTLYRGSLSFEDFATIVERKLALAKRPLPQQ